MFRVISSGLAIVATVLLLCTPICASAATGKAVTTKLSIGAPRWTIVGAMNSTCRAQPQAQGPSVTGNGSYKFEAIGGYSVGVKTEIDAHVIGNVAVGTVKETTRIRGPSGNSHLTVTFDVTSLTINGNQAWVIGWSDEYGYGRNFIVTDQGHKGDYLNGYLVNGNFVVSE